MSDAERARQADPVGLREAAVRLRAAAVKAGAHIVVTTDYPDGVKAFGILCDAIDAMDDVLDSLPAQAAEPDPGLAAIAGHSCPQCRRVNSRQAAQPVEPGPLDVEAPEGWRWECVSCDRPVSPMGMCETCGVFGVMRIAEDAR